MDSDREGADHATEIANARAIADVGVKNVTSRVLAIRGQRLALTLTVFSGRDQRPDAFHTELLRIGGDRRRRADRGGTLPSIPMTSTPPSRSSTRRYLAGEAAAYAQTWSALAIAFAGFNRHELPKRTPGLGQHRPPTRSSLRGR